MKKILLAIVLLPILIFGAIKGYVWYTVKSNVEQVIEQVRPFIDIRYGSIRASLKGEAGLNDVIIVPIGQSDEIRIGSMSLKFASLGDMLNLNDQMGRGEPPELLQVKVENLHIPLDGSLMDIMEAQTSASEMPTNPDALGCGDLQQFNGAAWREMGYESFDVDFSFGYEFVPNSQQVEFVMSGSTANMFEGSMKFQIALGVSKLNQMALMGASPALRAVHVDYKDLGYYARRNQFCAKQAKVTVDQFVESHTRLAADFYHSVGFQLPQQLVEAYQQLISKASHLKVAIIPDSPLELYSMGFYKPEDMIDLLNLQITLNGKLVDVQGLGWDTAKIIEAMPEIHIPGTEPKGKSKASTKSSKDMAGTGSQIQYQTVDPYQLEQYVGKLLRASTTRGQRVFGKILRIEMGSVIVERRVYGGKMTFPVQIDQIKKAEVYHRAERP